MYPLMMSVTSRSKCSINARVNSVAACRRVSLSAQVNSPRADPLEILTGRRFQVTPDILNGVVLEELLVTLSHSHIWQDDLFTECLERVLCCEHVSMTAHLDNNREEFESSRNQLQGQSLS